jgi:hypothetical protein
MHGGITDDGQSVLLVYKPIGGLVAAYVVNTNGFTWRTPPSDIGLACSLSQGQLSEVSEYLFYTRSGTAFGKNGEAKVVEAYSIRHLARLRAVTFGFGESRYLRNTRLLPQLRARGPIYMAIETPGSRGDDSERDSPALVASSDRKLHWNFAGIGPISRGDDSSISISADDTHMAYIEPNTAMLHYRDLKTPSLRPLGSIRLPGVQYSPLRKWLMYGKKTTTRDAIPKQIHRVRYSPNCKVITIVTANYSMVVINVLLTFNLRASLSLPGFCSFYYKLYTTPPVSRSKPGGNDVYWGFVLATLPPSKKDFPRWETRILQSVTHRREEPASPFTRLVEEILGMKNSLCFQTQYTTRPFLWNIAIPFSYPLPHLAQQKG